MVSQKNSGQKHCIKCMVLLSNDNWLSYLKLRSTYKCTLCFRDDCNMYYTLDSEYSNKQLTKYRIKRSAVIFVYGNECFNCTESDYEKLTIDSSNDKISYNWLYNNKKQDGYQVLCYNCKATKNVKYKDKYCLSDKIKVINNYGNKCLECNEYRIERLSVNTINEKGACSGRLLLSGYKLYRWIIKNNYPSNLNFQILCFNCIAYRKSKTIKILQDLNH